MSAAARSASPDSEAQMAVTSAATRGSSLAESGFHRAHRRGIAAGQRRLQRDLVHLRREAVGVDAGDQQPRRHRPRPSGAAARRARPPSRPDGRRAGLAPWRATRCAGRYAPSAMPAACPSAASESGGPCRWPRPTAAVQCRVRIGIERPGKARVAPRAIRIFDLRHRLGLGQLIAPSAIRRSRPAESSIDGRSAAGVVEPVRFRSSRARARASPDRQTRRQDRFRPVLGDRRQRQGERPALRHRSEMCLVRGSIARNVGLDGLHRHLFGAPRQQECPADQQEDDEQPGKSGLEAWWLRFASGMGERLLPDLEPLCIAPLKWKPRQSAKADRPS